MSKKLSVRLLTVLSFLLILILVSCNEKQPDKILELEEPLPLETGEPEDGWKIDESGIFAYYEYIPTDGYIPVIDPNYSKSDNILIFSNSAEDARYGYMDMEFNVLYDPVNLLPEPFINGLSYLRSETKQGIVDLNFEDVKLQFGRMAVIGNNVFYCDQRLMGGTGNLVIRDIDPEEFLVPVKSDETMMTGFKTLSEYLNPTGEESENFQIPPQYIIQNGFREGMAAVAAPVDGKYKMGFINETGELAVPYKYDMVYDFCGGYATVYIKEDPGSDNIPGYYIIDKEGNEQGPYIYCEAFHDGFCVVYEDKGKATFITESGERISDKYYDSVEAFSEGYAVASNGLFYVYLNEIGQEITTSELHMAKAFSEGMAAAANTSGYFGFIDESGAFAITPKYQFAGFFSSGFAFVKMKHGEEGFLIDKSENQYLAELNLSDISKFNADGYALAKAVYISDGVYKYKYYTIRILP